MLQRDGRLVAVIVPEVGEIRNRDAEIHEAIRRAVEECSKNLPSYQRLSDYAVSREPLEYTQLGKLRQHLLSGHYDRAKESEEGEVPGPIPVGEMGEEDRELLEDEAAEKVWEMLASRYPDRRITPDTSPQLDLGVDSMEWVNLTMDIGENADVELDKEVIGRIETVRDLLREVAQGSGGATSGLSPIAYPDAVLDDARRRWLRPLGPVASVASWAMFLLDRALARGLFKLQVEGLENLP